MNIINVPTEIIIEIQSWLYVEDKLGFYRCCLCVERIFDMNNLFGRFHSSDPMMFVFMYLLNCDDNCIFISL